MMQRRRLYSLLLTSFILVFACSFSWAQTVTFESVSVLRGDTQDLDVTIDPTMDISSFEIVFEVSAGTGGAVFDDLTVTWDPGLSVLTHRYVDLSGFTDGVLPGTVRIAGMMIDDADACLAAAETVVAQVGFYSNDVCDGTVVLDGTTLAISKCNSCVMEATTQFVECSYSIPIAATVVAGTVTIANAGPYVVTAIDDIVDMPWGTTEYRQMDVDDNDLHTTPGGYETLTYTISCVPPIPGLSINSSTGAITCMTVGTDVGCHEATARATDACGDYIEDVFDISVLNIAPVIICQDDTKRIPLGGMGVDTVFAYDPDGSPDSTFGGPNALSYTVLSLIQEGTGTDKTGEVTITPFHDGTIGNHAVWTWTPDYEDTTLWGFWEICFIVTDQANTDACSPANADTCCARVSVISPGTVVIEKTHDALLGQEETVLITMENSSLSLGGYDFLVQYDQSALTFLTAELGDPLENCGWEYFVYREGQAGNCGTGCPTGMLRLVAMAEWNNGALHPDTACFNDLKMTEWTMAELTFMVTNNYNLECQYAPIRWVWYDCGDNSLSDFTGDTLFISRHAYNYDEETGGDPVESDWSEDGVWPNFDGALEECIDITAKVDPLARLDFWHGGIDIICIVDIDDRGDINFNDNAYEIADAVIFANYFVDGLSVFTVNVDGQIAATDVNADGLTLSVADLVYLIRVIVGDAIPYAPSGYTKVGAVDVSYTHNSAGLLAVHGADIGAVNVVVAGDVTPELVAPGMEILSRSSNNETRILVWSPNGNHFEGECLNVTGEILSIEIATADGTMARGTELPTEFALHQNYPNPFNPITTMTFSLPVASDYTLAIYNVSGQKVAEFSDHHEAGTVSIDWNANNRASGIYFYKLQANSYSETKKMVLLK